MRIESPRFGSLEINPDTIISFPAGMPGFEDCRRYAMIEVGSESGPAVAVLQGVDRPELAFSVTEPDQIGLHYEFTLTEEEEQVLRAKEASEIAVLLILRQEHDPKAGVHANLMAPLVINASTRIGIQKVIGRIGCDITLTAKD